MNEQEHMRLANEKLRLFIALAEEILELLSEAQRRIDEGYSNGDFKMTLRNRVIAGLVLKAGRSFERLIKDARDKRGECAHHLKTMVENCLYAYWVSDDQTETRARLVCAESYRSRAAYHESCSASPNDEDAQWGKEWRELLKKQIEGLETEWEKFSKANLERMAGETKSKDFYNVYRLSCEAAHTGDLPQHMPPHPTKPGLTLEDLSLQQCYVSISNALTLSFELLMNISDQVGWNLESEVKGFWKRWDEIRRRGVQTDTP